MYTRYRKFTDRGDLETFCRTRGVGMGALWFINVPVTWPMIAVSSAYMCTHQLLRGLGCLRYVQMPIADVQQMYRWGVQRHEGTKARRHKGTKASRRVGT
jgi:hypothetical protein